MTATRSHIFTALTAFVLGLVVSPAPTAVHAGLSPDPVFTPEIEWQAPAREVRRVNSDFCLTESEMAINLSTEGFYHLVLGENAGRNSMRILARYGDSKFEVFVDRCTGRLQTVVPISKSELMYL